MASEIVTEVLPELLRSQADTLGHAAARDVRVVLRDTVARLSRELHQKSKDQPGLKGMGATVVAI